MKHDQVVLDELSAHRHIEAISKRDQESDLEDEDKNQVSDDVDDNKKQF